MHSLLQEQAARAYRDELRGLAEPVRRPPKRVVKERSANLPWLGRYVVVEETRCCGEGTPSW
jgi:hypothetical protein